MRATRGISVVEALVAVGLAGLALAALAATGGLTVRTLRLARDGATALALVSARLEALRAGPRVDGSDETPGPDGTRFTRDWQASDGRGGPTHLAVGVRWGRHLIALDSEVFP